MTTLVIARRELAAYFLAPISYVVATLFLVVQGYSFWLFCELLNARDSPHGAVLQYFFGGTFLYWLFLMFVVSVIAMRLVAEERRAGTLEPLLTAPVDAAEVIAGKFLGAVGFYAALWAPTILYVLVLRAYAPDGAMPDAGPILAGYLGTLLVGASALAIGLFASTVTRNQILAAVLAFVILSLLLLVGALGDSLLRGGWSGEMVAYCNLFRHMDDFGRGIVDSRRVVYHVSVAALALFAAARVLDPARQWRRTAAEITLLAAMVVSSNYLAARHYTRGDWTAGRSFSLSDKTVEVVRALQHPVDVLVFMLPSGDAAGDLYDDVHELTERARRLSPQLRVEYVDVDREPERLKAVATRYRISGDDLVSGVIVVDAGEGRSKYIVRDELADWDDRATEEGRPPRIKTWKGEQALVSALLTVTEERARRVCFTKGHGEPALDSLEPGEYGDFAEELRRDHLRPDAVTVDAGVPPDCDLVVVAGPEEPLAPRDVAALDAYLARGGRLLALVGPTFDLRVPRWAPNGLEPLLAQWGVALSDGVVVDVPALGPSPVAFAVSEGYADHPITAHLMHHRTRWAMVRQVRAAGHPGLDVKSLIHTSDAGWAETDLGVFRAEAKLAYDAGRDTPGPISIAAAVAKPGGARLVVLGSADLAGNRQVSGYNRDLLLSAVDWLLALAPKVAIGPRTPAHLRLELDDRQLTRIFVVCVLALPLVLLLLGAGVFWIRRS